MKLSGREKMSRLVDAMIYGDSVTKRYLYGIVLLTLGTVVLAGAALLGGGIVVGLSAMIVAVVDLIWWQSMTLTADDLEKQSDKERYIKEKKALEIEKIRQKEEKKKQKLADKEEKTKEEEDENQIEKALGKAEENTGYTVTSEEIRYMLKRYKAKKDHREVIIDSCDSLGLKESPAYIWADKKNFYLLVLTDGEPVKLDYPLEYNMKIHYVNGTKASPETEYRKFKVTSLVSLAFEPFLPDYYQKRTERGTSFCKNLYRFGKDMYFTNTSAKNVFDITGADFELNDEVTADTSHGEDFKNAYKANVLWRDGVLSSEEYKEMIAGLLSSLARADIRFDAFNRILEQMYEYNFITKAYVDFYIGYRKKYRENKGD